MREIALDTETTGFEPKEGHRIVEIGCVELINHIPTENHFHVYINPERDVPEEVVRVHGLNNEFLDDKPVFSQVATDFVEFIKDSTLVIHNAAFDMRFLNHELEKLGFPKIKNEVIDSLAVARAKFPGSPANLDALCRRFDIDNSNRELHGALLDAELLAEVYLELCGGRQPEFFKEVKKESSISLSDTKLERKFLEPREFPVTEDEEKLYSQMLEKINR